METYIAALDQGTTTSRAILFNSRGGDRIEGPISLPADLPSAGMGGARSHGDLGHHGPGAV